MLRLRSSFLLPHETHSWFLKPKDFRDPEVLFCIQSPCRRIVAPKKIRLGVSDHAASVRRVHDTPFICHEYHHHPMPLVQ